MLVERAQYLVPLCRRNIKLSQKVLSWVRVIKDFLMRIKLPFSVSSALTHSVDRLLKEMPAGSSGMPGEQLYCGFSNSSSVGSFRPIAIGKNGSLFYLWGSFTKRKKGSDIWRSRPVQKGRRKSVMPQICNILKMFTTGKHGLVKYRPSIPRIVREPLIVRELFPQVLIELRRLHRRNSTNVWTDSSNNQTVIVSYWHGRMTTALQCGLKPPFGIGLSAKDQATSVISVPKLLQPALKFLPISFTRFHRSTFEGGCNDRTNISRIVV